MEDKLMQLAENEEFCKKVADARSTEDAIRLFAEEGVEVTAEEVKIMFANIPAGELDESTLESVAGGCLWLGRWWQNRRKKGGFSGGFAGGGGGSAGGSAGGR